MVRLLSSIFFMHYIPNSFLVEFSGCTDSYNNHLELYRCQSAIDGKIWNYWRAEDLPAWAIFELTEESSMNSIELLNGYKATAKNGRFISFKVTLNVDGQWIQPSDLQVKEDSTAQIESDGTVTLNNGINDLTLEFTTVTNVHSIRLDVTKVHSLHVNLREIIPGFIIGKF